MMNSPINQLNNYLRFRCYKGLQDRGLDHLPEYQKQLEYEISIITSMGFAGYFLIVCDILEWCRQQKIPVGTGRGSCAGSLTVHSLGITALDPIKYKLIFERFMNPARVSMPDIDLDFCQERVHEVIQYLREKYGSNCVAHIGTYGSMKARAAIRDVSRVLGYEYQVGDHLANLVLAPISGKAQPLKTCYEQVPQLAKYRKSPETKYGKVLSWAEKFEDRIRSFGTHASGVVVSAQPIHYRIPLYPDKDGNPTTQFEMNNVEEVGLIKFDILSLRALTTIQRCRDLIFETTGEIVDPALVPIDDQKTYELLQRGDVNGVFQLEGSSGLRDLVIQIKPTCLEDLSAIVAIYRPGPLGSSKLKEYLDVRAGRAQPKYLVPELEPILKETGGWLIYQEQIMDICRQMAGYTTSEADNMRKVVGKKLPEKLAKEEPKFKTGIKREFSEKVADELSNDIKAFGAYGFNKAHAISYGYISYQMAYLKAHYPVQFFCACLTSDGDEVDKVIRYVNYCKNNGISVLPPSINHSGIAFALTENKKNILYGLRAIKNVGVSADEIIIEREKNGAFSDLVDFCKRVNLGKINKKKLVSLIMAGAFDEFGLNKASLAQTIDDIYRYNKEQASYLNKQETYERHSAEYQQRQLDIEAWGSLSLTEKKEAKLQGKKKPGKRKLPTPPEVPAPITIQTTVDFSVTYLLQQEREMLGCYITGHPLDCFGTPSVSLQDINEHGYHKQKVIVAAVISTYKEITTKKKKQKMAYVSLEDKSATIDGVILPEVYDKHHQLISEKSPALFEGQVDVIATDTGRVVKLRIINITALQQPVSQKPSRPIYLTAEQLQSVEKLLSKQVEANAVPVELHMIPVHHSSQLVFYLGKFWFRGREAELENY